MQELEFNIMTMIIAHLPVVLGAAFTTRAALTKTATAVKSWSILPSDWEIFSSIFLPAESDYKIPLLFREYVGGTNQ